MPTEYDKARQLAVAVLQSHHVRTLAWFGAGLLAIGLLGLGTTAMAVDVAPEPWDKLLHFATYATVTALVALGFGGRRPWLTIAIVALLACLDEGIQRYEPGRHADIADLIVDVVAAGGVSALCAWLMPART